ncbi:MAG TPA: hypothetical protein DCZ63_08530 [Geobacter sp.]|nr:hypothetical protein [Geobacter sp.]
MEESRIIKVDIRQGDIEHTVSLADFVEKLVAELRPVTFRSRVFSTKGVPDPQEMEREQRSAIDRVIQRIRDDKDARHVE